jgi:ring-1,2-phenylacetyl-CoA epoxidase subunit PaaE
VLYGNRTSNSIMFLEELAKLKDLYLGRFQIYHFLTAEADDVELFNGRLDEARIADVLASLVDPKSIDVAFICGPSAMMDTAERAMLDAGLPSDQVLVERFTAGRLSDAEEQADRALAQKAAGLKMQLTIDGRQRSLSFKPTKEAYSKARERLAFQPPSPAR